MCAGHLGNYGRKMLKSYSAVHYQSDGSHGGNGCL